MTARPRPDLPLDLDLPVPDHAHAEGFGLEHAGRLRDRLTRERETVRALREYLEQTSTPGSAGAPPRVRRPPAPAAAPAPPAGLDC